MAELYNERVLSEEQILRAVAERWQREEVSREAILAALLTEDEADLLVCLRREREEGELPWEDVRETLVEPTDQVPQVGD